MKGYPTRYVVYDTETTEHVTSTSPRQVDLRLRLGVAIITDPTPSSKSHRYPIEFKTSKEFHDAIQNMPLSRDPIYIFAHNIGFDVRTVEFFRLVALGTYSLLPPMSVAGYARYRDPLFITDSPPFIVRLWRRDGQQLMLIDTYQWCPKSLAQIGEEIGRPKAKMPSLDGTDDEWFDYCMTDVDVLLRCIERVWEFLKRLRLPDFCTTPASQAMLCYRMRYERKRIIRPENPDVFRLDRMGYYGGQVEAFRLGLHEANTYQLDVTSLYPFVMLDNLYPCAVETHREDTDPITPDDRFDPRCTTAEVYIDSPEWPYPVRGSDETLWVNGRVRTVLCGPELERAHVMGHIVHIGRYVRYLMDDLFSDYVSWLWDIRDTARRAGDKFTADLAKSLLNTLHGKFGQRTGEWRHQGRDQPNNMFGSGKVIGTGIDHDTSYRILAGHTYYKTRDEEDPRGFAPIAAWCASYGRCFMHDARYVAGENNVLYQATDSLLVDGEGLGQLQLAGMVNGDRLGTFRHEETYPWVAVRGVHNLDLGDKRKRPGVPSKALLVASETYEIERWQGFDQAISMGNVSSVSISTVYQHCKSSCTRRHVNGDGTSVPHRVDNWHLSPEDQAKVPALSTLAPRI
jgi:hypothetical protein